jgi:tetratricopeptide (TPR) repeat protein
MAEVSPAMHRAILFVDVAGYGDQRRTNRDQVAVRHGLYAALWKSFTCAGLRWERCHREDRGDGLLILVPAEVPKELLTGPLPIELAAALERHNQGAPAEARIKLRAALHAGEVHHDEHGVAGTSINLASRLLEAEPLKQALRDSPGSLALIASEWFYDEVVRHHPESNPAAYRPACVSVKETRTSGWIHLPGVPQPSVPALPPGQGGPHQPPAAVRDFVGRAAQLEALDELLTPADDAVVITAITGSPGVGKTALALHAAHRVRDRFPDGRLYVDLHGYAAGPRTPPQQALDGLLRALDVPGGRIPTEVGAQSAMFRSLLDGRRVLVVLDNAASPSQVRPLLPGTPGCAVMVTSRCDLGGLVARDGARPLHLGRLAADEAIALLRRIVGAPRVDAEPGAAADLARRCAYLPLALRIAAERAAARRHLPLAGLVEELDERNRLDVLDAEDEDTAIRTVMSWSYNALPPEAARMFRLLALHPGPEFSLHAATALSPGEHDTRSLLDTLLRAHLIEERPGGRYRLSGLLRCYAVELAEHEDTAPDCDTVMRRILAWYLHSADNARLLLSPQRITARLALPDGPPVQPLTFASVSQAKQWCETERLNLMTAARRAAATGNHDIGWRLPQALWTFFFLRGPWTDWVAAHRLAVNSAQCAEDDSGHAYALGSLGYAFQDRWCFEDSANHFLRAQRLFKHIRDRQGEAWALHGLGHTLRRLHRFDEAILLHGEVLRIASETGDHRNRGWALSGLGFAYAGLRRYLESLDHFQQALTLGQETDRRAEGWALYGLGYTYQGLDQNGMALAHYCRALDIFRELGDWAGEGETLDNLGKVHLRAGSPQAARNSWTLALEMFKDQQAPQESRVRKRLLALDGENVPGFPEFPETEAAVPSP